MRIAIDGPAGSGKSTIAKAISKTLGLVYLDTGAMYRAATLNVIREGISLDDDQMIINATKAMDLSMTPTQVIIAGEDVSEAIRTQEVTAHVSAISKIDDVRYHMVDLQREIAKGQDVIMDGRDIGTYVLPNAEFKFFLIASVEERARRRKLDFDAKGENFSLEFLMKDLERRDAIDSSRAVGPLKKADDAVEIDTTTMSINEVIETILKVVRR